MPILFHHRGFWFRRWVDNENVLHKFILPVCYWQILKIYIDICLQLWHNLRNKQAKESF